MDATTRQVTVHPVFVAALGALSFTYAEVCESQALRCWIAGHIHAFEYVGGVTAVTVPDNPKTAVIGPDFYEPDLHATYAEMAQHYGTAVIPARVRRPRDKEEVEHLGERDAVARGGQRRAARPPRRAPLTVDALAE